MRLRARLLAVVGLVALPLLVVAIWVTVSSVRRASDEARHNLERVARTVVSEERTAIERGRHLLVALAEIPVVRDRRDRECATLFARLLAEYAVYTTLGVTDAEGTIVCSAPAAAPGTTLADRPIFRRMREAPRFTVGVYTIGRLSGKPSLGLAYPIRDHAGTLSGMIFGALDVTWLHRVLADIHTGPATSVTLIDRDGTVFLRLPEARGWVGKSVEGTDLARTIGAAAMAHLTVQDLDGRTRIAAVAPLTSATASTVVVGVDRQAVLWAMSRDLLGLAAVLVLIVGAVLAVMWIGGERLLVRPLRRVIAVTRRFADGDLASRVGDNDAAGEIGELGRAFDQMADALSRRTRQAELAEQRYRGLFERNLAGIFRTRDDRLIDCNPAYARIFGYDSAADVLAAPLTERYMDPGDREHLIERLAGGGSVTGEFRGRRKDGSAVWVLVQLTETRTESGTYREGMVIDVTARREQETLAREATALREVAALAAAAAHEINNPLAVLQGHMELVLTAIPDPERVSHIRVAIGRITEILARMNRITRLEKLEMPKGLSPMLDIRRSVDIVDDGP